MFSTARLRRAFTILRRLRPTGPDPVSSDGEKPHGQTGFATHDKMTAQDLLAKLWPDLLAQDLPLLLVDPLPKPMLCRLDLSRFVVQNPQGHKIRNCSVWFPANFSQDLRARIVFQIKGDLENCNFVFFRIPDKSAKLVWAVWGRDHCTASFSTRRMTLYLRLSDQNCRMAIGDAVYIGGGRVALSNTTMKIGACGLWSDGILIQGTDSHGIVDLDRMEIINDAPSTVTLQRRVWLGRNAVVMKNVTIHEGSIVATGSVVAKDVPPASAVAGSPARVVRERVSWTHKQHVISEFDKRQMLSLRDRLDAKSKD